MLFADRDAILARITWRMSTGDPCMDCQPGECRKSLRSRSFQVRSSHALYRITSSASNCRGHTYLQTMNQAGIGLADQTAGPSHGVRALRG